MTGRKPFDQASAIEAEDGEVVVDGPDGVAISLTPEAAVETSHRLLEGAVTAQGQKVQKRNAEAKRCDPASRR